MSAGHQDAVVGEGGGQAGPPMGVGEGLDAEGYTRQQAAQRLAGDLAFYGYPADAGIWLTEIGAALGSPRGRRAEPDA